MLDPKLVEAVGAEPIKTVPVEDLYKGQLALFADRAVWVEERLGTYALRGVYPFAGASNVELREGFLGKELSFSSDGKTVCFRKLLAADAQELLALFGGTKTTVSAAPVSVDPMPPASRPQASQQKSKTPKQPRPRTGKLTPQAIIKATIKPALIVAAIAALSFWLPYPFNVLASLGYWVAFGALGAWDKPDRYPVYVRYGSGAAAIALGFYFAGMFLHFYQSGVKIVLCTSVIALGAFAAQPGVFDRRKVAAFGAAIGLFDSLFVSNIFGYGAVESFVPTAVGFMLFWTLMALVEQEPELQKLFRPSQQ